MKVSCQWLSDFLNERPDAARSAEALTMAGFPVEHVERVGDDDEVMDVEVTSNRPDLLSHIGIARELAAVLGMQFHVPVIALDEATEAAADATAVRIDRPDLCPHYTARIIHGVRIGPSPEWMQRRLSAVGLRPINNVVDVTNYVLMETGQPLHAFDFDKLAGGRIVVRTPREGETLRTLDGVDRLLTPDMLCICDADRPAALAGVMGGEQSEVTLRTLNILLESARFDPLNIRTTSRRLRLASDASYRFERGLDPLQVKSASRRACQLILDIAGGTLLSGCAEAGEEGWAPRTLHLRFAALGRLLGVDLPHDKIVEAFARLGLAPVPEAAGVGVTVPSHRRDLNIEADLIEEAARLIGYDQIPVREAITVTIQPADQAQAATNLIRDALVGGGYFEAVTFSFVTDALRDLFLPTGARLRRVDPMTRKADAHLRPSLLPGLCESLRHNEAVGNGPVHLFETGSVFMQMSDGSLEQRHLALAGGESYATCRGMIEALLNRLHPERAVVVEPAVQAGFGHGACGRILWGDQPIGHVGKLDRAVADRVGLRHVPAIAEMNLAALVAGYQPVPTMKPLSRHPAVRRDVSLVVDETVRYDQLNAVVQGLTLANLEAVEHAATYRGKPLAVGRKSVTLTLVFRKPDGTLTREEADASVQQVVHAAGQRLRAEVRA